MWRQLQESEISCACLKSHPDTPLISDGQLEASCVTDTVANIRYNNSWRRFQNSARGESAEYLKMSLQANYNVWKSMAQSSIPVPKKDVTSQNRSTKLIPWN